MRNVLNEECLRNTRREPCGSRMNFSHSSNSCYLLILFVFYFYRQNHPQVRLNKRPKSNLLSIALHCHSYHKVQKRSAEIFLLYVWVMMYFHFISDLMIS